MKNKLPEGWKEVELGEILIFNKSGCWGDESDEKNGTLVIRSTNFTKDLKLKKDKIAYRQISKEDIKNKKLEYGDLLLEKSGGGPGQPVGRVIIFDIEKDKDFVCGNFIQLLRPNKYKASFRYLYYYLNLLYNQGFTENLFNKTTGIQNLRLKDYLKIKIPLPPIQTQKKIVSILENAEKTKEMRKDADDLTKDFLKSVFYEMFGDPITNPKRLVVKKLGEVSNIIMGQSPNGASYNGKGNGTPLLNGPTEFGVKFPKEKQWTNKPTKLCMARDILFCVRGATAGRMNLSNKVYCIGRGLCAIRAKESVNNEYIYEFLKTKYDHFQNIGQGSTFINIDKEKLINLLIPIPSKNDSNSFVNIAQNVERLKEEQEKSKEQIDNLFNALMQKAFKGELEI